MTARLKSFTYAFKGFKTLLKEPNFAIHLIASVIVITFAFILKVKTHEWLFLVISIGWVLFAEAINTSLEHLVDLVSPDYHDLAKKCKDIAAFSVLVSAITALVVGLIIFVPYLV